MRTLVITLCVLTGLAAFGCIQEPPPEKEGAPATPARIGIYDSRAIAVAYCGSTFFRDYIRGLHARHDAAKTAGDKKGISEAEAKGKEQQKRLHAQGFSTAPVDDILQHIKGHLPDIKKEAAVNILVSKWDKKSLAKYKTAQKKDVTMLLVEAFDPDERTLKAVEQIQAKKPISLRRAETIND